MWRRLHRERGTGYVPPLLQMAGNGRAPWTEEQRTRNCSCLLFFCLRHTFVLYRLYDLLPFPFRTAFSAAFGVDSHAAVEKKSTFLLVHKLNFTTPQIRLERVLKTMTTRWLILHALAEVYRSIILLKLAQLVLCSFCGVCWKVSFRKLLKD